MSRNFAPQHHPLEIRYESLDKELVITFEDNQTYNIPAELLRVESPSAEVQGHGPGQKVPVGGRMHVGIIGIEPVGNYAIKIKFDDLHDTGIYSWDALYDFATRKDEIWQNYLEEIAAAGLKREP